MLKIFEHIVEQKSQQMGCPVICRLYRVPPLDPEGLDKPRALMKQRKHLRARLLQELEKKNYKHSKLFSNLNLCQKALSLEQEQKLLTPGLLPKVPFVSISLSHCFLVEGFIIAPVPKRAIGFDLERLGRVGKKTALRISNTEELNPVKSNQTSINFAPSPSALWSAKEAVYKSFSQGTRHIPIKQISVFNWKQQQTDWKKINNLYWFILKLYSLKFQLPWIFSKEVESLHTFGDGRVPFLGINPLSRNKIGMNKLDMSKIGMSKLGMSKIGMNKLGMSKIGMNKLDINKCGINKIETFNKKQETPIFETYDYQFKITQVSARSEKSIVGKGFVCCFVPKELVIAVAFPDFPNSI